jgi:flagellar motility protein MotE (MotC chaperone)
MNNPYQDYFNKRKAILKKKQPRVRKIKNHTWLIVIMASLTAGLAGYLFSTPMGTRILDKVEVSVLGQALAESKPESKTKAEEKNLPAKTQASGQKETDTKANPEQNPVVSQKSWSDEEVTLFTKLDARKQQLDGREADLNKLDEELQLQKQELEKRLAELEDLRVKIANRLEDKVKLDEQKVETLVSVYSNMKPAQAAKVMEGVNEDLVVAVLGRMKNKSAAEILNLMDSEKAKKISEKFVGFREPASKK